MISSSPCRASSSSLADASGNGIVSVYVRPSVSMCRSTHSDVSSVARANGSSPPYISTANAASSSTPTGSQTRYGDSQIGSGRNESATSSRIPRCAATHCRRQVSAPAAGNTRFATTPSTR